MSYVTVLCTKILTGQARYGKTLIIFKIHTNIILGRY